MLNEEYIEGVKFRRSGGGSPRRSPLQAPAGPQLPQLAEDGHRVAAKEGEPSGGAHGGFQVYTPGPFDCYFD